MRCTVCHRPYEGPWNHYVCPYCGGSIESPVDLTKSPEHLRKVIREGSADGIWGYRDFFHVPDGAEPVSMGEGGTPLLRAGRLGEKYDLHGLYLKNETLNPSGTYKDRFATVAMTLAKADEIRKVAIGSAGNAAAAVAAYAAKAGMECYIILPPGAVKERAWQNMSYGGHFIHGMGGVDDCVKMAEDGESLFGWKNMCTTMMNNPLACDGYKTIAYEIARSLHFEVPDYVIVPVGGGIVISKIFRGFEEMQELGLIDRTPKMIAVQAAGCAPLVKAYTEEKHATERWENGDNLIDCTQAYETDSKGNYRFRDLKSTDGVKDKSHSDFIYQLAESCWGIYNPEKDMYEQDDCQEPSHKGYTCGALVQLFGSRDLDKTVYQQYAQGVAQQNFDMFFNKEAILAREDVNKVKEDNRYFINYKMGVSTAVGVAVLYLFLIFCIDIAIRSIKLGFLQMIAPIPILSYCDPKSSKDGMFQRWVKMCTTTYLDLFFRLAALYFGIYVISLVGTFRDVTTGNVVSGWLVSVFMIVGILIFVKKLPDIIKDVFNIKGDGKFTLNPMKKLGDEALGGKAIAGVGKRAIGLGAGLGTAGLVGAAGLMTGQGLHKGALGKAIAGGWRGDKFGKNFASSYGAGHQRHLQFKEAKAQGLEKADVRAAEGREGRQISHATQALKGIQNQYKQFESTATKADVFAKEFAKQEAAAIQRGDTDRAKRFGDAKENRINQIYSGKGGVVTKIEPGEDNENQKRFNNMINEIDAGTSSFGANTIEKYKIDHTVTPNATLQTIGESIGNAVNDTNSRYETVVGYTTISTDKGIVQMNKDAGTSLNSIETDNASIIAAGQIQPGGKLGKK